MCARCMDSMFGTHGAGTLVWMIDRHYRRDPDPDLVICVNCLRVVGKAWDFKGGHDSCQPAGGLLPNIGT